MQRNRTNANAHGIDSLAREELMEPTFLAPYQSYGENSIRASRSFDSTTSIASRASRRITKLPAGHDYDPLGYELGAASTPYDAALDFGNADLPQHTIASLSRRSSRELDSPSASTSVSLTSTTTTAMTSLSEHGIASDALSYFGISGMGTKGRSRSISEDRLSKRFTAGYLTPPAEGDGRSSSSLSHQLNPNASSYPGKLSSSRSNATISSLGLPADADFMKSKLYLRTIAAQKVMDKERAKANAKGKVWKEDAKLVEEQNRRKQLLGVSSSPSSRAHPRASSVISYDSSSMKRRTLGWFSSPASRSDSHLPLPLPPTYNRSQTVPSSPLAAGPLMSSSPTLASIRSASFPTSRSTADSALRQPPSPRSAFPPPLPLPVLVPRSARSQMDLNAQHREDHDRTQMMPCAEEKAHDSLVDMSTTHTHRIRPTLASIDTSPLQSQYLELDLTVDSWRVASCEQEGAEAMYGHMQSEVSTSVVDERHLSGGRADRNEDRETMFQCQQTKQSTLLPSPPVSRFASLRHRSASLPAGISMLLFSKSSEPLPKPTPSAVAALSSSSSSSSFILSSSASSSSNQQYASRRLAGSGHHIDMSIKADTMKPSKSMKNLFGILRGNADSSSESKKHRHGKENDARSRIFGQDGNHGPRDRSSERKFDSRNLPPLPPAPTHTYTHTSSRATRSTTPPPARRSTRILTTTPETIRSRRPSIFSKISWRKATATATPKTVSRTPQESSSPIYDSMRLSSPVLA